MYTIYIFSGLGVDKRVFDGIDFGPLQPIFLDWIPPLKNESLTNYSKRISKKIKSKKPILIGLSFGGIVATEVSKIIQTENIILLASAKTKFELPLLYRILGKLKINKLIPAFLFRKQHVLSNWFFGIKNDEHKKIFGQILKDTDVTFLKWALNEIANWKNTEEPSKFIHIHGNKDKILPIKNVKTNFVIDNGGHFMTVCQSKEIETIIRQILS